MCVLVCFVFAASLSLAQTSDEEGLRLRRQRMPGKSLTQSIIAVPTVIIKFPFFATGKAIKYTAVFIDEKALVPRTKALLTSDDGLVALYPTVSLGGRSGLGGELKFFNKRFLKKGNKLSLQASYTTNRHQNHYIRYQIPEMIGPFFLDARGGYQVTANEDFFGIGNDSSRDDRTNFRHEELGGCLTVGAALTRWFRMRLHADYTDHVIEDGEGISDSTLDRFNSETVPGLEGAALLCLGGSIAFDTRDNDFSPSRGGLVEFATTVFNQVDGDEYGFTRYALKLSHYLTLFRIGRVLAVQLTGEINTRLTDDRTTPFFERADLGGSTSLRGYSTGRFRGKDLILLNVEYRYPIWDSGRDRRGAMDAVIFTDVGRVFSDLKEDTFRDYKISYGFGIRARTIDGFLFRAEIARSTEETNLMLKFEPIF
jgi:outer membrane protein assembly factor BamA